MWGIPIGILMGFLTYWGNVRFAAYITGRSSGVKGYAALYAVMMFLATLGVFFGLAFAGTDVLLSAGSAMGLSLVCIAVTRAIIAGRGKKK